MPIDYRIERKKFEVFGDQIGAILTREFKRQLQEFDVEEAEVEVYRERIIPVDTSTEGRVINVQYASTEFEGKHQGNANGPHVYFIDLIASHGHKGEDRSDELSHMDLQRMMGIAWEILEHPSHNLLELGAPNVGGVFVRNMEIMNAREGDNWLATTFGRLTFEVRTAERTNLSAGNAVLMSVHQVRLGTTDKGYRYEYIEP